MCMLGITLYANDCVQMASDATNWDESQGGCMSRQEWQQAYCDYYGHCMSM